jgi:hypothetical protein
LVKQQLAVLPELGFANRREIAALAGLAPLLLMTVVRALTGELLLRVDLCCKAFGFCYYCQQSFSLKDFYYRLLAAGQKSKWLLLLLLFVNFLLLLTITVSLFIPNILLTNSMPLPFIILSF